MEGSAESLDWCEMAAQWPEYKCEGKCEAPPNRGVRQTWWCGFTAKGEVKDHEEHDHRHKGWWYHCYG